MKLKRTIPKHKKTVHARWCRKEWMKMSDTFRAIRSGAKRKHDKCFWCKRIFEDGEMMALACFEKYGNRTLCQTCADKLIKSDDGVKKGRDDESGADQEPDNEILGGGLVDGV